MVAAAEPQTGPTDVDPTHVELATALFSLAFHSLKDPQPVGSALDLYHPEWDLFSVEHALGIVSQQFERAKPAVVLNALVRLAYSRTQNLSPTPPELARAQPLLAQPFAEPESGPAPAPSVGEAFDDVLSKFPSPPMAGAAEPRRVQPKESIDLLHEVVANPRADLTEREAFAAALTDTAHILGYPPPAWTIPVCADDYVIVDGIVCNRIHTSFRTSRAVDEMCRYIDPLCWPGCCAFFADMKVLSFGPPPPPNTAVVAGTSGRWIGVFDEVVVGLPVSPLISPLQFAHYETNDPQSGELTCVQNTYRLVTQTPNLLVDQGYMYAKQIAADDGMTTYVELEKIVKFAYPTILDVWPDFPCATYWGALTLAMATACSSDTF